MAGKFVHLHTHSHYTFLQALPKVEELVEAAKANGMSALALTDSGNMHGAIEFYKAAKAAGIKPILGVDAYLAPRSRFEKDPAIDAKRSRIVLLAENMAGYKNLLALVTASWIEGFFERPRMDKELLRAHAAGILAIIPSFAGDVAQHLRAGDASGAAAALAEFKEIFGPKNLFLELTHHPKVAGHEDLMRKIARLGEEAGVPLVAQHDVYYISPEDREATETMRRIQLGGARRENEEEDFSFISEERAGEFFKEYPEAVDNSGKIAERCELEFTLGKWTFPAVPHAAGFTDYAEELRAKTYAGIKARGLADTPALRERIEYELAIVNDKGFAPYFLAVSDLLTFAKSAGILTTTRGSAAGSLVGYLTGITNVDPIFYKLPFERFLNPERPKAPDIDMDIADDRREELINYAKQRYGAGKVAQIGTFGTLLARAAVRDVSRALGHSYGTGDRIAKLIPIGSQGFPMTIERALGLEPELKQIYEEDDDAREIIELARRIEGCVRHVGVHAAGVVIAPTPLAEWTPLQPDPKGTGRVITQYDMYSITDEYGGVGLLKFDFLGITNLSILADSVRRVRENRGVEIDIENVPIDDAKTFEMLARGETEGTFQLNGSGMTRYLKELKPTTIHDINAMVALYRPGPMETIPQYIERKKNPRLIRYLDERMRDYLDASYGLLVYQDDVLLTAIKLAGYSWLEADALRKAMGKKIPAEMEAQKEKLLKGFKEFGKISKEKGEQLWKLIEPFAAYGFNKAHAASYGKVAYQTAYMKANYPLEYMASVLTYERGDVERIAIYVAEAKRMGIEVLPPDVNESGADFTITPAGAIRFGLSSIKNFGEGVAKAIIEERGRGGAYKDLADFLTRVGTKNLNRKSLESLIKCGALDSLGDRGSLLSDIETLLSFHKDASTPSTQASLFGALAAPTLALSPGAPVSLSEKLNWEKELLGIYVSGHPLDAHEDKLAKSKLTLGAIKAEPRPGLPLILPLLVAEVRTHLTKGGEKMAFIKFEDRAGEAIEAVAFPKLYKEHAPSIASGKCLLIKGTLANRNGELSLALDNLKLL